MSDYPRYDGKEVPKEQWTSDNTEELRPSLHWKDALLRINQLESELKQKDATIRELAVFIEGEDCFCFEEEDGNKCKRCEALSRVERMGEKG